MEPIVQGEEGELNDDGSVVSVEGFTSFFFESGGSVQWTFNLPGGRDLRAQHPDRPRTATTRAARNSSSTAPTSRTTRTLRRALFLHGELRRVPLPAGHGGRVHDVRTPRRSTPRQRRHTSDIDDSQALTLAAGAHTLRIEPVWGFQSFATIEIVDEDWERRGDADPAGGDRHRRQRAVRGRGRLLRAGLPVRGPRRRRQRDVDRRPS